MSLSIPSITHGKNATQVSEGRPAVRRVWLEAAGVAAVSLISLIPHFHLPIVDPDEGILASGAERILRGQVPYRDFFSELGPASFYLHALIFKLGSIHVLSLRLTAWLLGGALTALLYVLARRLLRAAWAVAAVAAFPLVCYPLAYRVSHHWWANLFLLLTVLALSAGGCGEFFESSKARLRWCAVAGALAGATLLAMQSKGLWAIVMGLLFIVLEPWLALAGGNRTSPSTVLHRAMAFVVGSAAILGLMAGYFASQGALGAWIDANLIFLFTNYRAYLDVPQASAIETVLHIGRLAFTQPSVHLSLYFIGYIFFFFLAPVIAFGGNAARLMTSRRHPAKEWRWVLLLLLMAVGGFVSEIHSPDIIHLIWGSPLMLILCAYQWERLDSGAGALKRPLQIAAVVVIALMLFTAGRKAINISEIDGKVETRRGVLYVHPEMVAPTQAWINAIEQRVPPGGETFFYPYMAEIYFLTATRNPTRYDVLLPDFNRAGQIEEAIASLERARPPYVFGFDQIQLLTIRPHFPDDPPDAVRPHPVGKALASPASGFQLETTVDDMEVWARTP
jgi:hypothetical protein